MESYKSLEFWWFWKFNLWGAAYYFLGVTTVVSASLTALRPKSGRRIFLHNSDAWNILAAAGAISATLIGAFQPEDRAARFNAAWIVLNEALSNPLADLGELHKAHDKGERILNTKLYAQYIDVINR